MNNLECVLDFGHGGTDPGACSNGYKEKIWNKETGDACHQELKRHNVTVHLTRKNDETLSISQRCSIANKTNAKWFVSIHHNAGGGDRGEAIHSIIRGDGKTLADNIGKELKAVGQSSIKVYDKKYNNTDYYGVIRGTKMHAVIVEVCFIDNIEDRKIADTLSERQRNGVAIAHAILRTMGVSIKGNSSDAAGEEVYYRVIAGSYKNRDNAQATVSSLKSKGYDAFIATFTKDNTLYYRAVAGSYKDRINADNQVAKLKKDGHSAFIEVFKK